MDSVFQATKKKRLPVKLSQDEINTFATNNAHQCQQLIDARQHKKDEDARHNGIIKALNDDVCRLTEIVNTGVEWRDVGIYETMDRKQGMVNVYRVDTDELIETRKMTPEERQGKLRLDED